MEPMTVSVAGFTSARMIGEAVAKHERNANKDIKKVSMSSHQKMSSSSTRQSSSQFSESKSSGESKQSGESKSSGESMLSGESKQSGESSESKSSDEDSGPRAGDGCMQSSKQPKQPKQPLTVSLADSLGEVQAGQPSAAAPAPARGAAKQTKERHDIAWEEGVYTVMIRQIPRHYSQLMFLTEMAHRGFKGLVDFIYFPFDAKKGVNVGYGFLNFTEPCHARVFLQEFDNMYLTMEMKTKDKPLRIHPAAVQGFDDNLAHFVQTKTGQKADRQYGPIFMPHGSWAGLPEEVKRELHALQQTWGTRPPGRLEAPAGAFSHQMPSAERLSARALESRGACREAMSARALDSMNAAFRDPIPDPRDIQAWGPGYQLHPEGFLAEQAPVPAAVDRLARAGPGGQVRAPPGLSSWSTAPSPCAACGLPTALAMGYAAPQCPAVPESRYHAAEMEQLWRSPLDRTGLGYSRSAASPPPPPTSGCEFMGTYQQLEEHKMKLMSELAAVHEEQRRTLVNSLSASRPPAVMPSASSSLERFGLGL